MKNIILLSIVLYFVSCCGSANKNAAELWNDGQKYRTENKLKESIVSYRTIINKYPSDNFSAQAQFQIADIYLMFTSRTGSLPSSDCSISTVELISYRVFLSLLNKIEYVIPSPIIFF